MKTLNERTMTLKLKRIEVIDLIMACTQVSFSIEGYETNKWDVLHDKLMQMLEDFDAEQREKITRGEY